MGDSTGAITSLPPVGRGLMLPPAPRSKRKREKVVLDEDDWTDKLEAIIQRDYFPDLPKLESQLEWLEVCTIWPLLDVGGLASSVAEVFTLNSFFIGDSTLDERSSRWPCLHKRIPEYLLGNRFKSSALYRQSGQRIQSSSGRPKQT